MLIPCLRALIFLSFFLTNAALAEDISPPVINKNVTIMNNVSPSQCPSSWRGSISPESITNTSKYGISTGNALVGVQSCSGCTFDNKSGNCVCATCYGYYN